MTAYPPLTGDEPCRQQPPDVFFPDPGGDSREFTRIAHLCDGCDVLLPCLAWAVEHERHGIWAGTTPQQRAHLRRMKAAA